MLRYVNKWTVLTLLTVMGGYLLASSLHFSGSLFSIIIQGLTVGTLVKRVTGIEPSTEDVNEHH